MSEPALAEVTSLFVSPHPDDIPLSIGGTAALASARGRCLQVTVFSAAGAGPFTTFAAELHVAWGVGEHDAPKAWEMRRREDQAAAQLLGLDYLALGFFDAIYRGYTRESLRGHWHATDDALADALATRLVALWRQTQSAQVYLPLSVGRHVDHVLCAAAAKPLRAAGADVWHYEDMPYAAVVPGSGDARLAELAPDATPRLVDVTETMDLRLDAIACHRSQGPMLASGSSESTADVVRRYAASLARSPGQFAERCWRAH
jgi:LmbE family N-acetylglucosaminyl deacetylase